MTAFSAVAIWTVIVAVSLVTYGLRASFLIGIDDFEAFPPTVDRLLSFFPIAVLSALVAPSLLFVDGTLAVGLDNARLVAGLVAFGVAWYTESILATVASAWSSSGGSRGSCDLGSRARARPVAITPGPAKGRP